MSFCDRCVRLLLAAILAPLLMSVSVAAAEPPATQYLLFQTLIGGPDPQSGVYHRGLSTPDVLQMVRHVADAVRPPHSDPDRILGFSVGPIAMDQGEDGSRAVIREAFDIALATDMAVALHLDDYMFWAQAHWPDGRLLRAAQGTVEWKDWSGTPAEGLEIGWLPNVRLPPQMCYESPPVRDFATYWTRDVVGNEVKRQFDRLVRAGKASLFAGVIVGWESNLAYGYCSLSHLGYSAQTPPADFDREREHILQQHIERWAKGIYDSGIPKDLIFTHLGPIPKRNYEELLATVSRARIREIHQSTALRAFWTAFNNYSSAGFSGYAHEGIFEDIHQAVQAYGRGSWAMVEGTNGIPGARPGTRSPLDWVTYLARSFNHGARVVNLFGGFQGPQGGTSKTPTETEEALAAYRKFLHGDRLVEGSGNDRTER